MYACAMGSHMKLMAMLKANCLSFMQSLLSLTLTYVAVLDYIGKVFT